MSDHPDARTPSDHHQDAQDALVEDRSMRPPNAMRLQRLTQPDWCNAPQPGNWSNACMRRPGHDGLHAVRKSYRLHEALTWPGDYPVASCPAADFGDLWNPDVAEAMA